MKFVLSVPSSFHTDLTTPTEHPNSKHHSNSSPCHSLAHLLLQMQLALQTTPSSSTQSAPDRVTTPIRIATSPMPARTRAPLNTEHVRLFAGSAFHDLMWAALSSYRSSTFPGRYIEVVTRFRNGFYATQVGIPGCEPECCTDPWPSILSLTEDCSTHV
jgi:hypothetical protein